MALFRALLFVFAIAVTTCVALFFVYGDRKFLRWAGRLFMAALAAGLLFFAGLFIERMT